MTPLDWPAVLATLDGDPDLSELVITTQPTTSSDTSARDFAGQG